MNEPLTVVNAALTEIEQWGLQRLADLWFPGTDTSPAMRALPDYESVVRTALAANDEVAAALREIARTAADAADLTPEVVDSWPTETVEAAYLFVMCAYYMSKTVRAAIGYPGQTRVPVATATPDQVFTDELLAPVIARGPIYVPTPGSTGDE
ncbi:hypothetical protein [Rhodococcus daqingensis]|uniref:Uncharacterized protein n=1 Tax=Rhodococcus daqingensis TaxID=2479363 RepID=A0ABW2RTJ2_9NOCA